MSDLLFKNGTRLLVSGLLSGVGGQGEANSRCHPVITGESADEHGCQLWTPEGFRVGHFRGDALWIAAALDVGVKERRIRTFCYLFALNDRVKDDGTDWREAGSGVWESPRVLLRKHDI